MSISCLKTSKSIIEIMSGFKDAVVNVVSVDAPNVMYSITETVDYSNAITKASQFGTLYSVKRYVLVIDARSEVVLHKDHYSIIESLNKLPERLNAAYVSCIVIIDDKFPLRDIW